MAEILGYLSAFLGQRLPNPEHMPGRRVVVLGCESAERVDIACVATFGELGGAQWRLQPARWRRSGLHVPQVDDATCSM